jgi:hypothetical protein
LSVSNTSSPTFSRREENITLFVRLALSPERALFILMKIFQARYIIFFIWMMIVPAAVSYFGGWDKDLNLLFVGRAFALAFFTTVLYYLLVKRYNEKNKQH